MVTCNHCGSELVIEAGRCKACGEETAVAERREALKVDATRLDEVPRPEADVAPGAWGRPDDDAEFVRAPEASGSGAVTEPDAPARGAAAEPGERATPPEAAAAVEAPASGAAADAAGDPTPAEARPVGAGPRSRPDAPSPPVLASELLRRELSPAHPHPWLGRISSVVAGSAGAFAVVQTLGVDGPGGGIIAAFAGLAALGLAPMPYGVRAAILALLASAGFAGSLWARTRAGHQDEVLPAAMVTMAASALFFRAWHRGSGLARLLVALGITLGVGFLALGGFDDLSNVESAWQSWAPHLLKLLLALLLLLSLLAFMDSRSTGGCNAWAFGLLLWYGADVAVKWVDRVGAVEAPSAWLSLAHLVAPWLTLVLSISLAQLLAVSQAAGEPGAAS